MDLPPLLNQPEQPIYQLPQNKKRALIPKILTLLLLGIIFHLGILLNLSLLELSTSQENITKLISLTAVFIIVIIGIFLAFRQAHQPYLFYRNHITFIKKQLAYTQITNTTKKQNFLDKIFHTYQIPLTKTFTIYHIPKEIDLETYLKQLQIYTQRTITPTP
jgi:hypothetical protein